MKKRFSDYLAAVSQYKSVYAWIVFIVLAVFTLIDINSTYFRVSLIVFLFTILLTILDTHKRIAVVFKTRYLGIHEAWLDIEKEMTNALRKKHNKIYWQGLTQADAWPQLKMILEPLIRNGKLSDLQLFLTQVEPKLLDEITGENSYLSAKAESMLKEIEWFKKQYQNELKNKNIEIIIKRYSYMPNFHGLLINDKVLFLSYVRWSKENIYVAEEPYDKYTNSSEQGSYKIELFKSWLDKAIMTDKN